MTKRENLPQRRRVAFLTLGCKVNFYETEKMMEQFREAGFEIVDFSDTAEIYIVNTCTVTNIADRKSRQMLHRAKKRNPQSFVVAAGCYVESDSDRLRADDAVDAYFTNGDKENIAERVIKQFFSEKKSPWEFVDTKLSDREKEEMTAGRRDIRHERTRAYMKVQDGCNQFCTYCLIPYVRGRGKLSSMPEEQVVAEVEQLAQKGCREVVLTGIHLSSYGVERMGLTDFVKAKGEPLLALIRRVAAVDGIERIRLGSLEPRIIMETFLQELAKTEQLCPHFHLSLQSGCDSVLQRMNRRYTSDEYRQKVKLIRQYFFCPAITTDVIVGFPGETKEEFDKTREYLRELQLADIHVFPYSPRAGTKAADMPEQVSPQEKKRRVDCLIADTIRYRRDYGNLFQGQIEKVLFEDTEERDGVCYLMGHNERYVKIGVPLAEARAKGYRENEIHEVRVQHIFY